MTIIFLNKSPPHHFAELEIRTSKSSALVFAGLAVEGHKFPINNVPVVCQEAKVPVSLDDDCTELFTEKVF